MKLITKAIIIATLVLGVTGCSIQDVDSDKTSSEVVYKVHQETKILKVGINLKEPGKIGGNYTKFLNELVKGGISAGAKNSFNIDLKEGQCLKIETDTKCPITVMLKDNSSGNYVYTSTSIPEENLITTDLVSQEGQYELMVDFNETEVFNFQVFIINQNLYI
jgi:hypothetical protein